MPLKLANGARSGLHITSNSFHFNYILDFVYSFGFVFRIASLEVLVFSLHQFGALMGGL